ncbi:MAG: hypothetical protein M1831_002564 [Alyxoria varia]|nr:MAG: hypothetical protein M1831_002564 [Alyxoria varia]
MPLGATAAEKKLEDRSPSGEDESIKEDGKVHTAYGELDDPDIELSEEERLVEDKKLVRKLDIYLIPWLTLLYLVSFLDRTNIGNARLYDLLEDLNMTDGEYYAALSVFFVSYSLFEPATNVMLKVFRAKIFLTVTMILWGICMTTMGLVHNFSGLAAARFFLGIAEAGLFPGINYYLSCWYKRRELGIRAAVFFSAAALAGSFGGLLAAAIASMDGIGGKAGWAWIFILEGLATILIGIASYWLVHDFPDEARFLTPAEKARVTKRLKADGQASARHEKLTKLHIKQAYTDWKTYAFSVVYSGCDGALYAFSLFTPSVISNLGYTSTTANLLSVPPYAVAAVATIYVGWSADRHQQRGIHNISISLMGMVGFCMLIGSSNAGVQYAGIYLGALGIYPAIANTIVWGSNNVEGVFKRGVVMGTVIGYGNLNGVMSSNIYIDPPRYYVGHGVVLAYLFLFLFCGSIVTRWLLVQENKKRKEGKRDYWVDGKSEEEVSLLGDKRPEFIYLL